MTQELKLITKETLKKWGACSDGYHRFNELFPEGADLKTAIEGLVTDNHNNWGEWLFDKAKLDDDFKSCTLNGYCNTGDCNTGNWNAGDWNAGDWNTGNCNTGNCNTGYRNTGYRNTGNCNTGNCNTGNWNAGDWNAGDWNTGNCNTGFFNTITPENILVFNKECTKKLWRDSIKPDFITRVELTYWVSESEMSDYDKIKDPNFFVRGGQLRKREYKEAWALAFETATKHDIELLKALPNFDADVFFDITGIRV